MTVPRLPGDAEVLMTAHAHDGTKYVLARWHFRGEWVVWAQDAEGSGVHGGAYYTGLPDALRCLAARIEGAW